MAKQLKQLSRKLLANRLYGAIAVLLTVFSIFIWAAEPPNTTTNNNQPVWVCSKEGELEYTTSLVYVCAPDTYQPSVAGGATVKNGEAELISPQGNVMDRKVVTFTVTDTRIRPTEPVYVLPGRSYTFTSLLDAESSGPACDSLKDKPFHQVEVVGAEVTLSSDTTDICIDDEIAFTAAVTPYDDETDPDLSWSISGPGVFRDEDESDYSADSRVVVGDDEGGTGVVSVTDNRTGCSDTAEYTIVKVELDPLNADCFDTENIPNAFTAEATVEPAGRPLIWTLSDDAPTPQERKIWFQVNGETIEATEYETTATAMDIVSTAPGTIPIQVEDADLGCNDQGEKDLVYLEITNDSPIVLVGAMEEYQGETGSVSVRCTPAGRTFDWELIGGFDDKTGFIVEDEESGNSPQPVHLVTDTERTSLDVRAGNLAATGIVSAADHDVGCETQMTFKVFRPDASVYLCQALPGDTQPAHVSVSPWPLPVTGRLTLEIENANNPAVDDGGTQSSFDEALTETVMDLTAPNTIENGTATFVIPVWGEDGVLDDENYQDKLVVKLRSIPQAERAYKITPEDQQCCTELLGEDGQVDVGSILKFSLSGQALTSNTAEGEWCKYELDPSIDFSMVLDLNKLHDKFQLPSYTINKAMASNSDAFSLVFWRNTATAEVKDVVFTWKMADDQLQTGILENAFQVELKEISLHSPPGQAYTVENLRLDGTFKAEFSSETPVGLYPLEKFGRLDDGTNDVNVYLERLSPVEVTVNIAGLIGDDLEYESGAQSQVITWDFDNFQPTAKFQEINGTSPKPIAEIQVEEVTSDFEAHNVTFTQGAPITFHPNQYTIELKSFVAKFDFKPGADKVFDVHECSGEIKATDIPNVTGALVFDLEAQPDEDNMIKANLSLAKTTVKLFGFDISGGKLEGTFAYNLAVKKFTAQNLKIKRDDFADGNGSAAIKVADLEFEDGELTKLKLTDANLKYRDFQLLFSKAEYVDADSIFRFSNLKIKLKVMGLQQEAKVTKFEIKPSGELDVEDIELKLQIKHSGSDSTAQQQTLDIDIDFPDAGGVHVSGDQLNLALGKFMGFDATLNKFDVTFSSFTTISQGSLKVHFAVDQNDLPKLHPVYITKGAGDVEVSFTNASDWTAGLDWDFSNIRNLKAEVRRGTGANATVIAKLDADFNDETTATGEFSLEHLDPITLGSGKMTLVTFDVPFKYDFDKNEFDIVKSDSNPPTAEMEFEGAGFTGPISFKLQLKKDNMALAFDSGSNTAKAFGMDLSGVQVQSTMSYEFQLLTLEGSLDAKHDEFDSKITGINFKFANSTLEKFEIVNAELNWKDVFALKLNNASYANNALSIQQVTLTIPENGAATIENFKITSDGEISLTRLSGTVDKAPVDITFDMQYDSTGPRFTGSFDGSFATSSFTVSVNGSVDIGKSGDFCFAHFSLAAQTSLGVPLGPSGLKLTGLAAEFGFNYSMPNNVSNPFNLSGQGDPLENNHFIGFGLSISDVSSLMEVEGYARITLGTSGATVGIGGNLKVPAGTPNFQGELTAEHVLGSTVVSGTLSSTIQIPASSGSVVNINNAGITYRADASNGSFQVRKGADRMTGTLLTDVDLVIQQLALDGNIASPGGMSGNFQATLRYTWSRHFDSPDGWQSGDGGTGFEGNLNVIMTGNSTIGLTASTITGSFNQQLLLRGEVTVDPGLLWSETTGSVDVMITVSATKDSSTLRFTGSGTVAVTVDDSSFVFDDTWNFTM